MPEIFEFNRVDRVMDILYGVAATRGVIRYGQIAKRFGILPKFLAWTLGKATERAMDRGEPMWSALVVSGRTGRPNDGFYRLARHLRPEYSDLDDEQVWQQERERCYEAAS